jgi:hypothetical protein
LPASSADRSQSGCSGLRSFVADQAGNWIDRNRQVVPLHQALARTAVTLDALMVQAIAQYSLKPMDRENPDENDRPQRGDEV